MVAGAASLGLLVAGCSGASTASSSKTEGVTITVAMMNPSPPQAALDEFTKETGITVTWSNIDWDSLQTKITAAATAKTYFADATDVDWSRVGQLGKLNWFYPLEDYLDTKTMAADMPQMSSFTSGGHVVGIPFDASFMVTTVNQDMFTKAGIATMPATIDAYTKDLQQIKDKGVAEYPLNIPFAAAEGLSTYWYRPRRQRQAAVRRTRLARVQGCAVDDRRDQERSRAAREHQRDRQPGRADPHCDGCCREHVL
jgi:multiple sugar transport system substrate-binding protein